MITKNVSKQVKPQQDNSKTVLYYNMRIKCDVSEFLRTRIAVLQDITLQWY